MQFYEHLAEYYNSFFPVNMDTVDYIEDMLSGKQSPLLLDAGSGTGLLTLELARRGFSSDGVDSDISMIKASNILKQINPELPISFYKADLDCIMEIPPVKEGKNYDAVISTGNTITHLPAHSTDKAGLPPLAVFLNSAFSITKPGGKLLLQILDYDYIYQNNINELPIIQTEKVVFRRLYRFIDKNTLEFTAVIETSAGKTSSAITLYPLRSAELAGLLKESGFTINGIYGSWKKEPAGGRLPLIIEASRA